jgi:hypothetical protein
MVREMAMRGAGLMMAVREGSEIGEPWAPAHGCQEEEKSGKKKSSFFVQLEMTRNRGSLGAGPVVGWKKGKEVGS